MVLQDCPAELDVEYRAGPEGPSTPMGLPPSVAEMLANDLRFFARHGADLLSELERLYRAGDGHPIVTRFGPLRLVK